TSPNGTQTRRLGVHAFGQGGGWKFPDIRNPSLSGETTLSDYSVEETSFPRTYCAWVRRYKYSGPEGDLAFQATGIEGECSWHSPFGYRYPASWCRDNMSTLSCENGYQFPTEYLSASGYVSLTVDPATNAATMRFPDGTVKFFATWDGMPPGNTFRSSYYSETKEITSNGNITTWNGGSVTDPLGRTTSWASTPVGSGSLLTSITKPGPAGTPETWSIEWYIGVPWTVSTAFPALVCYAGGTPQNCDDARWFTQPKYTQIKKITAPDGRTWEFTYGLWGNLTQVKEPGGTVRQWDYGDSTTPTHTPQAWPCSIDITGSDSLYRQRVTATRVYPNGLTGGLVETSTITHILPADEDTSPWSEEDPANLNRCRSIRTIRVTNPDGSYVDKKTCASEIVRASFDTAAHMFGNDNVI